MEFSSLHTLRDSENLAIEITKEEEFMAHCSNMQAWVEYKYDTALLHRSLSFPLLKKLHEVGDPIAKKVFLKEIKKRFEKGHPRTIHFLVEERFHEYLGNGWFIDQLNDPDSTSL